LEILKEMDVVVIEALVATSQESQIFIICFNLDSELELKTHSLEGKQDLIGTEILFPV
jgi:hypothetical protein